MFPCPLYSMKSIGFIMLRPLCGIGQTHICLHVQHTCVFSMLYIYPERVTFVKFYLRWSGCHPLVGIRATIRFRSLYFPCRSVNITHKAWMITIPCQRTSNSSTPSKQIWYCIFSVLWYMWKYLFTNNGNLCWLIFILLTFQHVSPNNNSHPQGESWHKEAV
jgi:hypothetical protein